MVFPSKKIFTRVFTVFLLHTVFCVHPCIFWVNHNGILLMYTYIVGDVFVCVFFFKTFKKCGPFLKVFIEFVTVLLLLYVLGVWSQGMWGLCSPTRDRTCTSWIGRQSLNHWTARDVPKNCLLSPFRWFMFSLENLFYPCFQSNETFQPRIFKI